MPEEYDPRDWPNVTLAEALEAASALGWTEPMEARAQALAAGSGELRSAFIFCLLNAIGDAIQQGTVWEKFPEVARAFYLRALADAGEDPPPWARPEDL
jgi:hypothetical protein